MILISDDVSKGDIIYYIANFHANDGDYLLGHEPPDVALAEEPGELLLLPLVELYLGADVGARLLHLVSHLP